MDAERYQRLKQLLFEANRVAASDRDAFLDRECGEDLDLPPVIFGALALLGEEDRAREVDREVGGRIPIFERMVGCARLGWNDQARDMLQRIVDGAPEEERNGLVERVPFYRDL